MTIPRVPNTGPKVATIVTPGWEHQGVSDSRFTTVARDLDDLLEVVDVDDLSDVETLLVVLFGLPVGLAQIDEPVHNDALRVTVWLEEGVQSWTYGFPMTLVDFALACASALAELNHPDGKPSHAGFERPDLLALTDGELISTLQRALGEVRLFNILSAQDESGRN